MSDDKHFAVDTCTVIMDGEVKQSDDFVAVLSHENGDASLLYSTDALTLGMAMKMIARAFVTEINELSEDDRVQITEILGSAFVDEKQEEINE